MADSDDPSTAAQHLVRFWPWFLLALLAVPPIWLAVRFPDDIDPEFPRVVRPNFSSHPPPAYRLAEPGDTIDRVGIYVSSLAFVLAVIGSTRYRPKPWVAAAALAGAAFWYAANPWPTFDGWHGIAWASMLDPATPPGVRLALATGALTLAWMVIHGLGWRPAGWLTLWRDARRQDVAGLFVVAAVLTIARIARVPDVEPFGYWPRWAFVWALVAFCAALVRLQPIRHEARPRRALLLRVGCGISIWFVWVAAGIELTWFHRPIDRLRAVVPGKIYMCAMPTARGLEIAQNRHHFKTIINLFPEDTPYRSPILPDELRFAREHGVSYHGSPAEVSASNAFLDETLRLSQDPAAWPILVHCHACMDRTPAWVGIYKFVIEGRPLAEVFQFMERHRGYRPKATVTLLYNRVLPRLAPERLMHDPTSALLSRCAEGTTDPYYEQVQAELSKMNPDAPEGVSSAMGTASSADLPNLTRRR